MTPYNDAYLCHANENSQHIASSWRINTSVILAFASWSNGLSRHYTIKETNADVTYYQRGPWKQTLEKIDLK